MDTTTAPVVEQDTVTEYPLGIRTLDPAETVTLSTPDGNPAGD